MKDEKLKIKNRKLMKWVIGGMVLLFMGCGGGEMRKKAVSGDTIAMVAGIKNPAGENIHTLAREKPSEDTEMEKQLRALGMVDMTEVDPSVKIRLIYATENNFTGRILYTDMRKAFMLPATALRLADAQRLLKGLRTDLSLMVYDAARPMSVQQIMWEQVKGTDQRAFVSNPANGGGLHNYGAAVDVTLADSTGKPLPMGSPFDYFGDEARPDCEEAMIQQGRIAIPELENRLLLRRIMKASGFRPLHSEWWHFNLMSREEAKKQLKIIP